MKEENRVLTIEYLKWINSITLENNTISNDIRTFNGMSITENDYSNIKLLNNFYNELENLLNNENYETFSNKKYSTCLVKKDGIAYTVVKEFDEPSRIWVSRIEGNDAIRKELIKNCADLGYLLKAKKLEK